MFDRYDPGDYRAIVGNFTAQRSTTLFAKARGFNEATKLGLRYERRVEKALHKSKLRHVEQIEHNPWFIFADTMGKDYCSPDFLLHLCNGSIIVAEVKLTWNAQAIAKLNDLYVPVVAKALCTRTMPLVICKKLVPNAPKAEYTISSALASPTKLLFWPDNANIQW